MSEPVAGLIARWRERAVLARRTLQMKQRQKDLGNDWVIALEPIHCDEIIQVADLLSLLSPAGAELNGLETTAEERAKYRVMLSELWHTDDGEIYNLSLMAWRIICDFDRLATQNAALQTQLDEANYYVGEEQLISRHDSWVKRGKAAEAQVEALTAQVSKLEGEARQAEGEAGRQELLRMAAEADLARMRALLKPLADAAYFYDAKPGENQSANAHVVWAAEVPGDPFNHSGADYVGVEITVGDCRAARVALKP